MGGVAPGAIWFYAHRNDADIQNVAVHVAVDCLPFLAAIAFALWPDVSKAHIGVRVMVIAIGLLWSVLLAKKDYLDLRQARNDQQTAIYTAVSNANQHSDQQMDGLKRDLEGSSKTLNKRLDSLSGQVSKSETDLNGTISKVIVPPTKYAQIRFGFFPSDSNGSAVIQKTVTPNSDDTFTVDFGATNTSDTAATMGEIWVQVCDQCTFAKEPINFDKPDGSINQVRHSQFQALNPGISLKMTIDVKVPVTLAAFDLALRYSCQTCGQIKDAQIIRVRLPVRAS